MPFDSALAKAISNTFRATCTTRITTIQRAYFESLLQKWFGLKNIRNAQLWTRPGTQTRDFINRNLGEFELTIRLFVANKFLQLDNANAPVKQKCWRMPPGDTVARESFEYFQNEFIFAYTHRIYFVDSFFCIEYYADSDTRDEEIDLDSPEFDDLIED